MKERLYGLDILRVISAIMIFIFHAKIHMDYDFGIFSPFVEESPIFMVPFFMISGFVVYYQQHSTDLMNINQMKTFYIKKMADIFPLYLFLVFTFELFNNTLTLKRQIFILPTEILGQQSIYNGLNIISHNSGSWYISCLIFCIFLSPFFNNLISQLSKKFQLFSLISLSLLCIYSQIVTKLFTDHVLYTNVVYRLFEYVLGMLICALYLQTKREKKPVFSFLFLITFAVLYFAISTLHTLEIGDWNSNNFVIIPCFVLLTWLSLFIKVKPNTTFTSILSHWNRLVYPFYIAQFYIWDITRSVFKLLPFELSNAARILLNLGLCYCLTVLFDLVITRPCKKLILKFFKL